MTDFPRGSPSKQRYLREDILDAIATRLGLSLIVGLLLAVCVAAGVYLQSVLVKVQENHATFNDSQVRNGYVAMSDLQRLLLVAQTAAHGGAMTDALAANFASAADIVYVRIDNFQRQMSDQNEMTSGKNAISALLDVIDIADAYTVSGYQDVLGQFEELLTASETARVFLIQFLDDMRRQADQVLDAQSRAVKEQQIIVLLSLAALTIVGSLALLFLRREVIGRRAREHAEERVEFLAFYDTLTKLPNRALFQDRLQEHLDSGRKTALLYIDIDEFKTINDTFGHAAGDAVLCNLGNILEKDAKKARGFAARLAGDEFAVVVQNDDLKTLDELCATIIEKAAKPFEFEKETLETTISIGLATTTLVGSEMLTTVDKLSRVTDFALYASKSNGRNVYTVYDMELERRFMERRALLDELPDAISDGDLQVYLQPKVKLPLGTVYGFEALVRWNRNGKIVAPGEFIEIAEQSGLILEIDKFVLNCATLFIANWNRQNRTSYSISVNLSAIHFASPRIIDVVEAALSTSQLPPELLTLEITETVEMHDWTQAQKVIENMHDIGCNVSIDDFGSGYSSLAYLRITSADELKVDKSLVDELASSEKARALLSSVLEIARNLEMEVVVEGIETETQAQIVQNMGGFQAQGYYFGRPQPAENAALAAAA
jgi:diguanylate cyclase (GGDEF)-like protein